LPDAVPAPADGAHLAATARVCYKCSVTSTDVLPALFGTALTAIIGCQSHAPASTPSRPAAPPALPDDGMVDVGNGASLHVHCVGEGSPMVLLDGCLGCQVPMYRPIWSAIGRFTRACGYDRAGAGYSSSAPKPHLARQLVGELRKILGERDESGAIVLVGHGLGGLVAQLYARDFPRSVAGMVLVDPQTKDYDTRYYAMYPPGALATMRADLVTKPENLDPDDVFGAMADLRRAPLSLGDRPLVVVTRGKPREPLFDIPADSWDKLEATWRAMEEDVTSLSRNSAHIVAPEAGWIPDDAPDRVVAAAWQVVSSVRSGVPLSRLPATAPPAASPPEATATTTATQPVPDDGIVDMGGGMSLHLHCVGRGTPTVVIDNGHGADGASWSLVLGDFGRITRTCVYDRPGIGFSSSPAPRQHSNRQMAHELQALLERAAIPGPYVLVAHSMGGVNVRLFQSEHPDEVVGMVLVDVPTEAVAPTLGNPDEMRTLMRDDVEGVDYDTMFAGIADLRASVRPLGDMPLVVLSAQGKEPLPPELKLEEEAAFRLKVLAGHDMVAHLSTNSARAIADHSGHFIQIDAPRLVVASVKQVVEAVRTHGRVDAKALEPFLHEGPFPPRD
jgi:pimeloyl-ACP methyl ester carboxylesterase